MARESTIDLLSAEDKTWLDKRFMDQGFVAMKKLQIFCKSVAITSASQAYIVMVKN